MAAKSFGLTSLTFGAAAISGYVVQSATLSSKPNLTASVEDENGNVVHRRYDDVTTEITLEAVLHGASLPDPGETFTYDSETYELTSIDVKRDNKGFKTVTLKGVVSEYI